MADDWIKMRGALVGHPKVIAMTRLLQRDNDFRHWLTPGVPGGANSQVVSTTALRCVVTALLMCVWSVARATGKFVDDDLHLPLSTVDDIDVIAGAPGVGAAMLRIGWLREMADNSGVILPNFVEFNVPMTNAEKQREYRKRKKHDDDSLPQRGNATGQNVTPRGRGRVREELSPPDTTPPPETTLHAREDAMVGRFEGHTPEEVETARFRMEGQVKPVAAAALALRGVGVDVTSQNPDLIAFVNEGGTAEHLLELAAQYPRKPAKYLITVARRELAESAATVTADPNTPRNCAPSRQANAIARARQRFCTPQETDDGDDAHPQLVQERRR